MPGPLVAALPWAIPAAVSAVGAVGSWLSGKGKKKEAEKKEAERADWAQGTYGGVSDRFKGYGDRAANLWQGTQDWGMGELGDIYGNIDSMVGYGARPGYGGEFDASKQWWQEVADTGWRSPEQKEAGWGWGNFKNFAETGGWSPQEMADFRARSSAGLPEMYGNMRGELMRGRTVQGGYGPGYNEATSQMSRDSARSLAEANLGAETNIANSVRQGKMWGSEQGHGAATGELDQMMGGQREVDSIAARIAEMNRSAGGGFSPLDAMRMKMGLIDQRTGLARQTGGEMDYVQPELAAYGGYANTRWPAEGNSGGGNSFWNQMLSSGANVAAAYVNRK